MLPLPRGWRYNSAAEARDPARDRAGVGPAPASRSPLAASVVKMTLLTPDKAYRTVEAVEVREG